MPDFYSMKEIPYNFRKFHDGRLLSYGVKALLTNITFSYCDYLAWQQTENILTFIYRTLSSAHSFDSRRLSKRHDQSIT